MQFIYSCHQSSQPPGGSVVKAFLCIRFASRRAFSASRSSLSHQVFRRTPPRELMQTSTAASSFTVAKSHWQAVPYTHSLRDRPLWLSRRSCMSVQSSPIACCGFSCRIRTFFFVHGKHRVCKSHLFSFSVPFYIYLYVFFCCAGCCTMIRTTPGFVKSGALGTSLALSLPFEDLLRSEMSKQRWLYSSQSIFLFHLLGRFL